MELRRYSKRKREYFRKFNKNVRVPQIGTLTGKKNKKNFQKNLDN